MPVPFATLIHNTWLESLASAVLAVLVALLAFRIAWVVTRRLLREVPVATELMKQTRAPGRSVLVFLALQFVWSAAPDRLLLIGAVRHATAIGLIAALTWLGTRLVRGGMNAAALLEPTKAPDNLHARRVRTQVTVIGRTLMVFVFLIGLAFALMTFPGVQQIGASLLASAGVAGLAVGFAAKPVLGNLIAGMQIALTQPIRLDDVLIVDGQWGRVEEITGAFVVVHIWDDTRLVVPLQWFIENPFQNWTRTSSALIGTVYLWVDYHTPVDALREELQRLCKESPPWDGRLAMLQVTDTSERSMQVRALVTAADSSKTWDLRCRVREGLIRYIAREHPEYLPRVRAEIDRREPPSAPVPVAASQP